MKMLWAAAMKLTGKALPRILPIVANRIWPPSKHRNREQVENSQFYVDEDGKPEHPPEIPLRLPVELPGDSDRAGEFGKTDVGPRAEDGADGVKHAHRAFLDLSERSRVNDNDWFVVSDAHAGNFFLRARVFLQSRLDWQDRNYSSRRAEMVHAGGAGGILSEIFVADGVSAREDRLPV